MCCLLTIMTFLGPRVAVLVWWLVDWSFWQKAFDTAFWPIIGILFAPWTTLFYMIAFRSGLGISGGWDYLLIVIGILLDLFTYFGGGWRNRKRMPGYAK
jgi:hypothetical protein